MTITEKMFNKLCRVLENYDTKKDRTKKSLYKMLNIIYNEWEYIIKGR